MRAPLRHAGRSLRRACGVALPVMLIILAVMLMGSLYLLRSSNSSTLGAANLAYDSALGRAADLGLMTGFEWLNATGRANKLLLDADSPANGYVATLDTTQTTASAAFWNGSVALDDAAGNHIEYVIHRMCALPGRYDLAGPPANTCMQTADNTATLNNAIALGASLASNAISLAGVPQVHYVVTARIFGPRGGNVVSQMVVLIGA